MADITGYKRGDRSEWQKLCGSSQVDSLSARFKLSLGQEVYQGVSETTYATEEPINLNRDINFKTTKEASEGVQQADTDDERGCPREYS